MTPPTNQADARRGECATCGHTDPHMGGGIGVCGHAGCGCDGPVTPTPSHPMSPDPESGAKCEWCEYLRSLGATEAFIRDSHYDKADEPHDTPTPSLPPRGEGEGNWTCQPGEILRETLEERGLRQSDLVRATGFTAKHVNQVIQGHAALTPNFALTLEESLGKPRAEFWCALQTQYDLAILRAATLESDRA